ncbi:SAM-dependent methyltransferase [Catelliglobosispora koreensis]|uniref:SAM-dependent methyltransferase n=1 Tax=Catelliglobosispora koreensis TaxID=129052 RepID=UPI00036C50BA|nr:cyclopropane-fatty-acyl-phospholipid synthase family protein [Catelliglobosispora koreensis]
MTTIAQELTGLAGRILGYPFPLQIIAWDGSQDGPSEGPALVIADRIALRRLLWQPNELGLAQAYVNGELDVIGDLGQALSLMPRGKVTLRPAVLASALRSAARHGILGPKPPAPTRQARLEGQVHSKDRDRAAISYHYDLSNEFYELILDPHLAYSCAYWSKPSMTLEAAQEAKLALICRKLGLRPGMRLLDVGCGWGSLSLYAASAFGAQVTAVTLSAQQHTYVSKRIAERGLTEYVEVLHRDYREISSEPFDAVATVEMGEHVGDDAYPAFVSKLHALLKPGGRLLVQQMSRGANAPGGGAFIESYIAPDMHMRPAGQTVSLLEQGGLEVRDVQAMREHYALTAAAWLSTLERKWDDAVELIGQPGARIWRLYLAGGGLAFAAGRMGVDQFLAVRPYANGKSGYWENPW